MKTSISVLNTHTHTLCSHSKSISYFALSILNEWNSNIVSKCLRLNWLFGLRSGGLNRGEGGRENSTINYIYNILSYVYYFGCEPNVATHIHWNGEGRKTHATETLNEIAYIRITRSMKMSNWLINDLLPKHLLHYSFTLCSTNCAQ